MKRAMAIKKKQLAPLKKWRPAKNPLLWGFGWGLLILLAHCSEFDPNEHGWSVVGDLGAVLESPFSRYAVAEKTKTLVTARAAIEQLQKIKDDNPPANTPPLDHSAESTASARPGGFKTAWTSMIDIGGLRQNWRLFQLPHPEVQGYEVRAFYREVKIQGQLYDRSFTRCSDLDDQGNCTPSHQSRLEYEMLAQMERRHFKPLFEAFSTHWAGKTAQPVSSTFRRIEFVVFRHAFKTSKDFSKRGSTQILFSKDL